VTVINNRNYQKPIDPEILTLQEEQALLRIIYKPLYQQLDSILEKSSHIYGFNGGVLLACDNRIIYQYVYGFSDLKEKKKITSETPFQLASVSKQFTAMAVMILKEQGKIGYDEPVQKYLPGFPYREVTVRHLLNHTSGLPNYMWLIEEFTDTALAEVTNDYMLKMLSDEDLGLNFTPGTRFDYSNTGYAVLASLVEKVSGESFSEFLEKHIFIPLGMKNSFVCASADSKQDSIRVPGYRRRYGRFTEYEESTQDGILGDKGIYSSIYDLYIWDNALNLNLLVKKSTIQEAYSPGRLKNNRQIPYGFGFRLKDEGYDHVVYHHGRWNGFRTAFVKYLPENTTFIILNNTSFNGISQMITAIRESMADAKKWQGTEEVVNALLINGFDRALEVYEKLAKEKENFKVDIKTLHEVAAFIESLGKTKKASEFREFAEKLAS
jgi:CubicO group peptidase (beta-lactamase class C family)